MGTGNGFATAQELQYSDWDLVTIFFSPFDDDHDGLCTGWGVRLGCFGGTSRFNRKLPSSIAT